MSKTMTKLGSALDKQSWQWLQDSKRGHRRRGRGRGASGRKPRRHTALHLGACGQRPQRAGGQVHERGEMAE